MLAARALPLLLIALQLTTVAAAQTFEVASIKANRSDEPLYWNFPLGPGDAYVPNGGLFSARNVPLATYILFAYKINGNEGQYLIPQLPDWVRKERFDIQARAEKDPGKDGMRLLMRALLADRFKLAMHREKREVPALAFVLAKPGKLGPNLRPHLDSEPCPTYYQPREPQTPPPSPTIAGGFPRICGALAGLPAEHADNERVGGRNVTIQFIADSMSYGLGRPIIDKRY